MEKLKVALVQLSSGHDLESNLNEAEAWIRKAALQGSLLVALPENFSFFGPEHQKIESADLICQSTRSFLSRLSGELRIHLLGGGYPTPNGQGKVFNTASMYGPDGSEIFRYYKIHLFDTNPGDGISYRESSTVIPGEQLPPLYNSPWGPISTVICYDLRFPEIFRALAKKGADFIFVPSAFTRLTGKAHWEVLLRARAIENSCFILAPAQTGENIRGRETFGHSMIVSPWGEIIAEAGTEKGLIVADLDLAGLKSARSKLPSLKHRRFIAEWETN
ncbi:hydrolase [Leptospira perolatii]|uniref:Hydrolase n=1 Tax=Leptospira perolatii TaxID=2023191 RepID=A0A2M9ZLZ8_9LEPT|nr:carbon-nitrogen hydrolase family protein [Leptospira perolatii]PJZ69728.1 hydrolase [Leptospira perolatii]PJZ73057.1 hydrolase [Leptospira perolatii]